MTRPLPDLAGRPVAAPDRETFLRVYGHLFEHSPWVVERAWASGPFADAAALDCALRDVLGAASPDERRTLACAHPELADRLRLRAGTLTASSAAEQASVGLDALSEADYATFHRLNAAYRDRFGFPFIICVRLYDLDGIKTALEDRLAHTPEAELREAIAQIADIGSFRLADVVPPEGIPAHDARLRHALEMLAFPLEWTPREQDADGRAIFDAIIVGGGQCGLGAAFGLMREGVRNIVVLDENPAGAEGPWDTYARMLTLRTPKTLTPIDFGIPSLTFRAWWEAQYGPAGWNALGKIPRQDWMRYLRWYRDVLDLPVRNAARVTGIVSRDTDGFLVRLANGEILATRKVVLATGIQGGGAWWVPDIVRDTLPPRFFAHSADAIEIDRLRGKRIGILGGGASAFDNANHVLSAGAASAEIFMRREDFPRVNPIRYLERSGMLRHFPSLDDARKYRVIDHFLRHAQPPTNDTFRRAAERPGFALHRGEGWSAVRVADDAVQVETPKGRYSFDFLILCTGTRNDVALRPELAEVKDAIALWRDRYTPPEGQANPLIDEHPYLGAGFELLPRRPADGAMLHGLFVFNYSALASLGLSASALSGLRPALPRLVAGVTGQLFHDRQDALLAAYEAYDDVEFDAP